jgi:hypothetical protein
VITKEEFISWRDSNVTRELAQDIAENVQSSIATLINRRTPDTHDDQWIRGFVAGVNAVLDWQPEFEEEKDA